MMSINPKYSLYIFIFLQIHLNIIISSKIIKIETLKELPEIKNSIIIFDIDETVITAETPFIYGLTKTDNFMNKLREEKSKKFVE